ncbi:hypothetical protein EDB92DRAFT_1865834 [Lactarius akahatsu]|uniref:Protein kinase domain-containing protein n=1 Tax=Lactarius akahatsu TaxID=416441 RepID=A0AAD4QD18_9AGAM|nr:hypothetical protein EDB92DRAFT_1865834 [Lactarius akahatsu]
MDSRGVCGRGWLGRGLIKGLGYFHEHGIAHRDIKPCNPSIEVRDENTEERKTGPRAMYSSIKADIWSCGRETSALWEFGKQLQARDPQQRPSLVGWDKWPAVPLSNMGKVFTAHGKESRPREEVDGVSIVEAPDAKRPRLSVTSEVSGQS